MQSNAAAAAIVRTHRPPTTSSRTSVPAIRLRRPTGGNTTTPNIAANPSASSTRSATHPSRRPRSGSTCGPRSTTTRDASVSSIATPGSSSICRSETWAQRPSRQAALSKPTSSDQITVMPSRLASRRRSGTGLLRDEDRARGRGIHEAGVVGELADGHAERGAGDAALGLDERVGRRAHRVASCRRALASRAARRKSPLMPRPPVSRRSLASGRRRCAYAFATCHQRGFGARPTSSVRLRGTRCGALARLPQGDSDMSRGHVTASAADRCSGNAQLRAVGCPSSPAFLRGRLSC